MSRMSKLTKTPKSEILLRPNLNHLTAKQSRWLWVLFCLVLITGVVFRFTNLDYKAYWHDESMTSIRIAGHLESNLIENIFNGREVSVEELKKYSHPDPGGTVIDTLQALAIDDPKHPPLFYAMSRLWLEVFGPSVKAMRGFAALLSLLVFPAAYWLCRELFRPPEIGFVAVLLMAVSPFHLLYAQEAYQYGLWTVTILLAAAALWRAVRVQSARSWGLFALTAALALYTHSLSTVVIVGHSVFVVGISLRKHQPNKLRLVVSYLLALLAGVALFMPWGLLILRRLPQIPIEVRFLSNPIPFSALLTVWTRNLMYLFVDTGAVLFKSDSNFLGGASLVIFGLIAYAGYFFWRTANANTRWFLLTLTGTMFISFATADLVLGGRRSAIPRYLIPSYLGVQILVAHLIGTRLRSPLLLQRRIWSTTLALLLVSGIASCVIILKADTWWNKYTGPETIRIANVINQTTRPLLISDKTDSNIGNLIALSQRLKPEVRLRLYSTPGPLVAPEGFSDVFLFNPSPQLQQLFAANYRLDPVIEKKLWRVQHAPSQLADIE